MMSLSSLEVPGHPGNVCKVIAHRGRNLLYKGKDDTNNAFVTFNLGKNKFATSVLEKIQAPEWNEECEFVISDHGGTLELVVCHQDFLRERFLGRVEISVSGVAATYGKCVKKWYKLQPKKGKEGRKLGDRGQLEVTVQILYRHDVAKEQAKSQERKSTLLTILPSPGAWRRKSSGASSDGRRGETQLAQDEYLNDINEMQFHDPAQMGAFYSDDSQSVASSMSDDHRDPRTLPHHLEVNDQGKERSSSSPKAGTPHGRFRTPGMTTGSARGKGGLAKNMKATLGNISKALSRDHMDKVGVSTPDLRFMSSSLPPTPVHPQHHGNGHAQHPLLPPSSGGDETDSSAAPKAGGVHLGVSSLGGALMVPAMPMKRAVSEENLLRAAGKGTADDGKEEREKESNVQGFTTLPRGKPVKREARHRKAMSGCFTTLAELGYHGDEDRLHAEHQAVRRKAAGETKEGKEPHGKGHGPSKYDTLTKQQLVQLVQQQESIMSKNFIQIKELEEYIENLLLRVMVESPHLLDQNHPIRL